MCGYEKTVLCNTCVDYGYTSFPLNNAEPDIDYNIPYYHAITGFSEYIDTVDESGNPIRVWFDDQGVWMYGLGLGMRYSNVYPEYYSNFAATFT